MVNIIIKKIIKNRENKVKQVIAFNFNCLAVYFLVVPLNYSGSHKIFSQSFFPEQTLDLLYLRP